MPTKFMGRRRGAKNRPRVALPLTDALKELESRTSQTVPQTAKILGSTVGAVRRDISAGKLQAFQMGRLWFVPSVVIRRRISPPA
jgi:hypothetical protein